MRFEFSPQRRAGALSVFVSGDTVVINGVGFDLSQVGEGAFLPASAIGSDLIAGPVKRVAGELIVPLVLPYADGAGESVLFPEPVTVASGPVAVPGHDHVGGAVTAGLVNVAELVGSPTQYDLDVNRYTKRAAVKDRLLAEMAADNMARVRSGVWTVVDLTDLMADPDAKAVLELIGTLSFELAAQALAAVNNQLLTPQIKAGWIAKLQANLYLVP